MPLDLVVIGLGYVGLPLARLAGATGLAVAGYDLSPSVVAQLNQGRPTTPDVAPAEVSALLATGFQATTDPAVIAAADTVVICVPTGLTSDGSPDPGPLRAAAETVAARLRPGMLVVLESTSYPGTTDEVLRPILERGSGLRAGEDFHLGFSPERIDPGNRRYGLRNTPKVVSGHTPLCAKHVAAFYQDLVDTVVIASGTREAEMAKLLENTFRLVNIALVNEVAVFCRQAGIDVWDVLHCAASKPYGFAAFTPGPGVGGHCIPVDPRYLLSKAESTGFEFSLVNAAFQANERMPDYVAERAADLLADSGGLAGAEVLLLGVTYKPDVPDLRGSPAFAVVEALRRRGADLSYHDPHTSRFVVADVPVPRELDLAAALGRAELTILLQDHRCYQPSRLARAARLLFDTRGTVPGGSVAHL
ncbi:nucleotide sugar dehydrogenase [Crossiella sp. CA-258035]|uniref:nucleotide sugar dehydrogenase n=1 Tax=Crossiella sp. CA-258035 TaxID=2981138 RepID=UPI0024BD44C4|nr:nucleotide sugar dehydrogenase [Crossiella sp. CA-258035]WHT22850.1 nucleotide sugar dehydrogenase [Crossiella sp. CA-258035]